MGLKIITGDVLNFLTKGILQGFQAEIPIVEIPQRQVHGRAFQFFALRIRITGQKAVKFIFITEIRGYKSNIIRYERNLQGSKASQLHDELITRGNKSVDVGAAYKFLFKLEVSNEFGILAKKEFLLDQHQILVISAKKKSELLKNISEINGRRDITEIISCLFMVD